MPVGSSNLGSEKKANANTFLADKNQRMVLVYKMLDPTSEHRVWAYSASTVTAPIDLFLCCPALVSEFGRFLFLVWLSLRTPP